MKSLISKVFLAAATASMAAAPVVANAKTRAATSPVFQNSAGLMQGNRTVSDEDATYERGRGWVRDGRVWSEEAGAWVDAEGKRWLLDDGKWYPLRGKLIPAAFLAGISAIAYFAVTRDNQSAGAN